MNTKSVNTFAAAIVVWFIAVASASAQSSAYSNAVTSLNAAGYWPMHEVTAAAPGDVETNYGSLGVLGNAYYADYQVNTGAFVHQRPGPLANGADKAVYFSNTNNNSGTITNSLIVPHTSPAATVKLPFTIELWYMISNLPVNSFEGDFISQCDASRDAGFRIYFQNAGLGTNNAAVTGADILFYNHTTLNQAFQVNFGAVATNTWHYMVVIADTSSNVSTYLDSVLQTTAGADPRQIPAGRFDPELAQPLTIGNGLGNQRGFNGNLAEVAVYSNAISLVDMTNHWQIGTNALAGANDYFNAVLSDNPTIYLRMNSSSYAAPALGTWPAVINDGTVANNGVYTPGTVPGAVKASAYGTYPFGLINTNVAQLSGMSSFADVGYANAYNPTGTMPFTVAALFRCNPIDTNRVQSIIGHGTNSWELGMTGNGSLVFNSGTNSTAVVATGSGAGDLVSTTTAYNNGTWHLAVAVHNGTTNVLYVDGVANNTNVVVANNVGNALDVMIGADPSYTNNPIGWGRQFAGQVCDAAFFTSAFTPAQARSLYDAIGVALTNISNPALGRVGSSDVFTVTVTGSSPNYQWYFNTVSNYAGATALTDGGGVAGSASASVTVANLNNYYFVVVTNGFSSVTSSIVQVPQLLTVVSVGEPIWNQAGQTNVIVTFSYGVDPVSAAALGNYSLNNGASILSSAVVASNEVALTTSVLNPATSYTLTVQNVTNFFGVVQSPSPASVAVGLYPANLAFWVSANSGVTADGSGNVSQWNDLSGNGNNLGNLFGPPYEPVLATNIYNDPVIRFNGTNAGVYNFMTANDSPSLRITGDMSVIAVMNFATLAGGTNGDIVSKTSAAHANVPAPYDFNVAGSANPNFLRGNGAGTVNGVNFASYATAANTVTVGTPHIVAVSDSGSTVSHFVDGRLVGTGLLSNGWNLTNDADGGQSMYIGARGDAFTRLTGDISEMIIAGSAISSYDMTQLGNYLIVKHNLPIIIPSSVPTNIVFSASGGNLTLSWPLDHTGWQLQSNSVGLGVAGSWFAVAGSTTTNKLVITPNLTKTNVFYRLIYQP